MLDTVLMLFGSWKLLQEAQKRMMVCVAGGFCLLTLVEAAAVPLSL